MRCVIEIVNGSAAGRRIWLQQGQALLVGRTEFADVCISDDRSLSQQHFLFEQHGKGFRIRDLGSTNGTYLNEEPTQLSDIKEGDVIMAGRTLFRITEVSTDLPDFEGTAADSAIVIPPDFLDGNDPVASSSQGIRPPLPPTDSDVAASGSGEFDAELTMPWEKMDPAATDRIPDMTSAGATISGPFPDAPDVLQKQKQQTLTAYRPPEGGVAPSELARTLSNDRQISLLVNITRVDQATASLIQSLQSSSCLERLSETIVMLKPGGEFNLFELISANWGRDALVTVFSSLNPSWLIPIVSSNVAFLCYPSMVVSAYNEGDSRKILRRMRGLDAVLVELPRDDSWLLLINQESATGWDTASFPFPAETI